MRIGKRWAGGVALMATAALTLAACGGGSTTDAAASGDTAATGLGGEINAGVAYETTDYSSITSSALAVGSNLQVLEGLYQLDMSTYEAFPALASGDPVAVSDTVYEITLRDGAKFSDGKEVTTEDVLSSYGRTTAEGSIYGQFFDFVKSVTAKDDKTITVELNYPFANVAARFADMKVVPTAMNDDELKAHPIGTGPYKYESITPTEITAVPNEFYNGAHPATVKTLRWHVLKDDSARLAAALDGTTDVMEAVPASAAEQLKAAGWTVDSVPGYGNPFLMFNTMKAPFNDAKVRQAIHKAIDKKKLIEVGMEGEAVEATSFLPESNPAYKKTATQLSYDLEGAKALLAEAGVSGLTINLVTTDHPWVTNLVPQIKSDLEALGLTVNHSPMASADLYSNVTDVDEPTYDLVLAPGDPLGLRRRSGHHPLVVERRQRLDPEAHLLAEVRSGDLPGLPGPLQRGAPARRRRREAEVGRGPGPPRRAGGPLPALPQEHAHRVQRREARRLQVDRRDGHPAHRRQGQVS